MSEVKDCVVHGESEPAYAGDLFGFDPCNCKYRGWLPSEVAKDMIAQGLATIKEKKTKKEKRR